MPPPIKRDSRMTPVAAEPVLRPEDRRLKALERLELNMMPDPALDEITRLVAQVCDVPAAAISFVERDRVWFKSRHGLATRDIPRIDSPCDETILGDDLFQIPDAAHDPHYENGVIPIGTANYRFYAGAPLRAPDGSAVGSLCIFDDQPRKLDEVEANALRTLARQIVARLELSLTTRTVERDARTRQRVESALTVERNFVSAVLDTVGALVVVLDTAGRIVRFNRICETISGYELSQVAGQTEWDTLVPAEDRENAIATYQRMRDNRDFPFEFENRWKTRDGSLRRIQWTATALEDADAEVAFLIVTGIDVTLQREAETTLRDSEGRYRELVEASLGAVFTHDMNGKLLSLNSYGAENLGYKVEEMVGRPLDNFMPKEEARSFREYLVSLATSGEAQGTFELCHRDSNVHVLAYRNRVIHATTGDNYALCFGVDITEKVRTEERLNALTRQSNSVLDSIGDGIFGTDLDGVIMVCNPAAAQMLGYRTSAINSEVIGHNINTLLQPTRADGTPYPDGKSPILDAVRDLKTVRVASDSFQKQDGTPVPIEYVANPILHDNKPTGMVVAFSDTTERRALDKMKDEFVSTVSHELRTPLTSMRASLGLIASGSLANRPDKQKQMLSIAIGNTDRLVSLVNDILDLERIGSGKAELHYTHVNAGDLMRRAADLLTATASKTDIRFNVATDGVTVWADADRILQTLTNLLSNAIKFSPPGGQIQLVAQHAGPDLARLEIHDQGRGIPKEKLEQIFGRFQQVDASDSRVMGGTGLGLAICRSIIAQHGGLIWAESEPGHGASFFFTLPTQEPTHR